MNSTIVNPITHRSKPWTDTDREERLSTVIDRLRALAEALRKLREAADDVHDSLRDTRLGMMQQGLFNDLRHTLDRVRGTVPPKTAEKLAHKIEQALNNHE